jgi:hypothetical protein
VLACHAIAMRRRVIVLVIVIVIEIRIFNRGLPAFAKATAWQARMTRMEESDFLFWCSATAPVAETK